MRTSAKLIAALSVAGLAVAAGSAFTGAGLITTGQASDTQFVGGTVSQSVDGAILESLVYGFVVGGTNTSVNKVTLKFADATDGKTPTVSLTGGDAATFLCTEIDGTSFESVCDAATGTSQTGVTSASVTVPSD